MTDDQIKQTARELTNEVEQGHNVSKELNQIPFDERAKIAHQMEADNRDDRASNNSIPKLEVKYEKDAGSQEHVMDMQVQMDPNAWIFKNTQDVYDLPAAARQPLLFTDGLKMAADSRDSEVLRDPDDYTSQFHSGGG